MITQTHANTISHYLFCHYVAQGFYKAAKDDGMDWMEAALARAKFTNKFRLNTEFCSDNLTR